MCVACLEDSAAEVGDYDQTSIRYTGRNIPSRSFRMLQHLTGSGDESNTPPPGRPTAVLRPDSHSYVACLAHS